MIIAVIKKLLPRRREISLNLILPFQQFFKKEASSSLLLIGTTLLALIWANSPYAETYHRFWETEIAISFGHLGFAKTMREWINEGLMSIFFFTVGLEIKREILVGELASVKKALLPVGAAIGGMLVPALIYFFINRGLPSSTGWGIPMATDIAFALGAIYILGRRIPTGIRVFLSAFAIVDDLGAVFVIALFYTSGVVFHYLLISLLIMFILGLANFFQVRKTFFYAVLGLFLWFSILGSGLHATVAGIIVAMFIPARGKYDTDRFLEDTGYFLGEFQCPPEGCGRSILLNQRHLNAVQSIELACHHVETPLQRLEHSLHPWVAFVVVPVFALANAGITFGEVELSRAFSDPLTLGIILGLVVGKPLGISLSSFIFVKSGLASLPKSIRWEHILGASMLGGIGFTMSLFIAGLSFPAGEILNYSKLGIITASLISGIVGLSFLYLFSFKKNP
ncbi:MAG TPA: Na+/H+ antiporter NhaA [Nitrospirae bacterium]|nr:Na(+)/H(+) antiporter NhaA [bacterium BMS3Abin08]HDY70252.1 Na+/H+ antiporter NhaA [Nitrospirota bacterium]